MDARLDITDLFVFTSPEREKHTVLPAMVNFFAQDMEEQYNAADRRSDVET